MATLRRWLVMFFGIALVVAANGCTTFVPEDMRAHTIEAVMAGIEKTAGSSDVSDTQLPLPMPYEPPVPLGAKPTMVGNVAVYLNVNKDTSVVVRPMRKGPQTLMYLTSNEAQKEYSFPFLLPRNTKLRKAVDGSVNLVDAQVKRTYPLLRKPWAKSVDGKHEAPTYYEVQQDIKVIQKVDLSEAKFPLVVDPVYDDPYRQLLEGRVPELKQLEAEAKKSFQKDGPSHDLGSYGRWYFGPNGLEIRFNNRGSLVVLDYVRMAIEGTASVGAIAKNCYAIVKQARLNSGCTRVFHYGSH